MGTVLGIVAAQEAYKRGQALYIVPFSSIIITLIPIFAGIFVFQQTVLNPIWFWIGVILIIGGASMLARFESS